MNRLISVERAEVDMQVDSFVVVIYIAGQAEVNAVSIKQGETLLVPASNNHLSIIGSATFLTATM